MKAISYLIVLLAVALGTVHTLFQKEVGINDWRIENLGEIKDLKFLENTSLVYTLSTTGLLTLFDTDNQNIIWKKELPAGEDFKLRYLSRNLLVYSQQRAMLINSASHIIYDVHLEGILDQTQVLQHTGKRGLAVEFFELKGHVYSVFAKDYKVIIYKDY